MPAFVGEGAVGIGTGVAQMFFGEFLDDPPALIHEDHDELDEEDEEDDNMPGPPELEPAVEHHQLLMDVPEVEEPAFPLPGHLGDGMGVLAHYHWLLAHQHLHHHHGAAAILNNLIETNHIANNNNNADVDALAIIPHMHLYGVLPEDIVMLFHAQETQGPHHQASTMRMLKKRILLLRERKPHYWHRVAFGLYKRALKGAAGGCDVRLLVKPKTEDGPQPATVWAHKFILANNPVFRQLLGYQKVEDSLQEDGGVVTDVDIPTITAEGMRSIVMAAYDLPIQKLTLENALYLEYWATRFCLDELIERCQKTIKTSPFR